MTDRFISKCPRDPIMRRYEDGTFKATDKQKQAAGRKGGKATGESKARTGKSNGRFSEGRERHECCGAIKGRSHKTTCENHRLNKMRRLLRKENIPTPVKVIDLTGFIQAAPVMMMLRGSTGVCVGCNENAPATTARKVKQADITSNPMRVVCAKCA